MTAKPARDSRPIGEADAVPRVRFATTLVSLACQLVGLLLAVTSLVNDDTLLMLTGLAVGVGSPGLFRIFAPAASFEMLEPDRSKDVVV